MCSLFLTGFLETSCKDNKPPGSVDHRAQLILYTMMMEERYQEKVDSGKPRFLAKFPFVNKKNRGGVMSLTPPPKISISIPGITFEAVKMFGPSRIQSAIPSRYFVLSKRTANYRCTI